MARVLSAFSPVPRRVHSPLRRRLRGIYTRPFVDVERRREKSDFGILFERFYAARKEKIPARGSLPLGVYASTRERTRNNIYNMYSSMSHNNIVVRESDALKRLRNKLKIGLAIHFGNSHGNSPREPPRLSAYGSICH